MKIDKRSAKWKEWRSKQSEVFIDAKSLEYKKHYEDAYVASLNASNKSKGLGDDIEAFTTKTGIKSIVHALFGEDCGCDERKEWLNKKFPHKNIECLTENEYIYLTEWFKYNRQSITFIERTEIIRIYNRILNKKQKDTTCSSCLVNIISEIRQIYDSYKD